MFQSFNYFGEHEEYNIKLCNPNKEEICLLNFAYNKELSLRFNEMSEFSMTIPYYYDNNTFEYYDMIQSKRLILIENIGYFLITTVAENDDGIKKEKVITSYSLETELAFKKINLFDGTYKFYDPLNVENTLLGKVLQTTNWNIGNIDSDLWDLYRTFEIPDSTVYEFLMNEVETSYECIFLFDSFTRTISAYTLENVTKNTDIILNYYNLINQIEIEEKSDEIVTALSVYGGNDLGISAVNPLGTNVIYDFSYFLNTNWMTEDLINAITNWNNKIESSQEQYSSLLTQYKDINNNLVTAKSELEDLKTERDSVEGVMKVMIEGELTNTQEYTDKVNEYNSLVAQVSAKESQISSIQDQINVINSSLKNINESLSFSNNFTSEQYELLKTFIIENTYQNDSFITTSEMTNSEIQDVTMQLYNQSKEILNRVSQPRFTFEVDSVNFLFLKEFEYFSKQLELGCIINIEKDEGYYAKPILLEIDVQLDDPTNFSLTFGNRYKLDSSEYTFKDLFGDAIKAGSSVKFDSAKWGEYVNSGMNNTVTDFINSALDTSKNNLINAVNQEIVINQNGLKGRNLTDSGDYSPNQVWLTSNMLAFTSDNWQTVGLALGEIEVNNQKFFGLLADAIVGKLIAGNQLQITNENNNFVLDSNGAVLNNASFSIVSDNGLSQILLNPSQGISIQTRSTNTSNWSDSFYVDNQGNIVINGKITANSGSIGGWQIGTDRLYNSTNGDYIGSNGYGKLSLLSWTPSSATFDGRIYASNLGDQIKTGNIQDGSVTASKLDTVYATKVYADQINSTAVYAQSLAANAATIQQLNATNARINSLDITSLKFNGRTASWDSSNFVNSIRTRSIAYIESVDFENKTVVQKSATVISGYTYSPAVWFIRG